MSYSEDEKRVIDVIASHIRRDTYKQVDDDYMFEMKWAEILTDGIELYDRLVQALESLRQRNFDTYTPEVSTLNGYIMKAKLNKTTQSVKLLISAQLVLQLISSYQDEVNSRKGPIVTLEELKAMVGVQ